MSEENKNNVAAKLRSLRAEYNYTQTEVAKMLNVSQQTYSNYEKDNCKIDTATLLKICELYGVSADYILGINNGKQVSNLKTNQNFIKRNEIIDMIADEVANKIKNKF